MKSLTLILAALLILSPLSVSAASPRPSIKLVAPEKKAEFVGNSSMQVTWEAKNITRDMVVVTEVKLVKKDPKAPSSGYVSGSGYQHTLKAGDTSGGFSHEWGLNQDVPGTYAITAQLRECSKEGCSSTAEGKKVGKKTKPVKVVVKGTADLTTGSSNGSSRIRVISPNGGESYVAGSGKKLSVKWEATNVPKDSIVCVVLENQGADGRMFGFNGDSDGCVKAKEGVGSVTGTLTQTPGYNLAPGKYWARISLVAPSSNPGKDGSEVAADISDKVFVLR